MHVPSLARARGHVRELPCQRAHTHALCHPHLISQSHALARAQTASGIDHLATISTQPTPA
eukprot:1015993-Rhodomonas_salina.2